MKTRREFLNNFGCGMLLAGLGPGLLEDLGLEVPPGLGDDDDLVFGDLEPLVALMEDTAIDDLLPRLVRELRKGTEVRQLVAAGALANARTFGGHDYDGFHCFMALMPSYRMSQELAGDAAALPALKVLYRNTARMHAVGDRHRMQRAKPSETGAGGMFEACREGDLGRCEAALAGLAQESAEAAYAGLLPLIHDDAEVHRVVIAWRAWDLMNLTGKEYAAPLLRQSVGFCVDAEQDMKRRGRNPEIRTVLPKLLDEYELADRAPGTKTPDDAWIDDLSWTLFRSDRAQGAEAVAAALAEGIDPQAIGEALSLTSTRLLLHDPGRSSDADRGRRKGSVHGASVGVHSSDSAHAWRGIAGVAGRHANATWLAGAYHTAGQGQYVRPDAIPFAEHEGARHDGSPERVLRHMCECIDDGDQVGASAFAQRYAATSSDLEPFFQALLGFACHQDGALHAEKYFRTVRSVHATSRPAFAGSHLVALARVTASQAGDVAPGVREAEELLKG